MRAGAKYTVNRTGLKLSPYGVPTLLVNGFDIELKVSFINSCINDCATQKEECTTPGEEVNGSISAVAVRSLLVWSVSVTCDRPRQS